MRYSICFLVLLCAPFAAADPITFRRGSIELGFDEKTGNLLTLTCDGQAILKTSGSISSTTFHIGDAAKPVYFDNMKLERKLDCVAEPEGAVELATRAGDYEFIERWRIVPEQRRIDRSVRLINHGKETVKLRGVGFRWPGVIAQGDGFFRFPMQFPPTNRPFAAMQPGRLFGSRGSIASAVVQLSGNKSIVCASCTQDTPTTHVWEGKDQIEIRQNVGAAGYLRPNEPQEIGFVSLQIANGDYWTALPRLWDWMDSVGLKVPADTPDWVRGSVMYSFHPGGTIGSQFKDLGGFDAARTQLLPTLPRLGVDSIWIMPIEYKSPYWPLDYYRFMEALGTAEQYRALVKSAHDLKLHVLQDLVPHGGAPQAVHNQAHPEFMLQREDGTNLNYWLNDFALPAWQKFIADVATHYVKQYDIDGYRVDACYGSKEMNWNPTIPYARASYAQLKGGLEMLGGIRQSVKALKPRDGAILAEVESARHAAVSDVVYDFNLCYNLLHQWRKSDAGDFVRNLSEYLEEQKYAEPRGTIRLRHVESHDALRGQFWYGVDGMRAIYALTAWIDGLPLIYHGQETGHEFELSRINALRKARPELAHGEALYRAVRCDQPGVFTCLRKSGERSSVVVINFNRQPVSAKIEWESRAESLVLQPMEYTVLPRETARPRDALDNSVAPPGRYVIEDDVLVLGANDQWFVQTIEGPLHGYAPAAGDDAPSAVKNSSIYWRPQDASVLWQNQTQPLMPTRARIGVFSDAARKEWKVIELESANAPDLRLVSRHENKPGLFLVGAKGLAARTLVGQVPPLPADRAAGVELSGVNLRVVGSQYIISNNHYEIRLNRQGGTIAQLIRDGKTIAGEQDLYGDQEYFAHRESPRMQAACDVECGISVSEEKDGVHLRFEGQLRGFQRFALKRPPLWYRNEYVFDRSPQFKQTWAFKTDKAIKDQKAFLAFHVSKLDATHFKARRTGQLVAEERLKETPGRQFAGQPEAQADRIEITPATGSPWVLSNLKIPSGAASRTFFDNRKLFITCLDSTQARLAPGQWHIFSVTWKAKERQ